MAGGMCGGGVHGSRGMHGRGHAWQGLSMAGGHAWQEGMCGGGGGVHGRRDGHCSGMHSCL